jgi:hypothetical protein
MKFRSYSYSSAIQYRVLKLCVATAFKEYAIF